MFFIRRSGIPAPVSTSKSAMNHASAAEPHRKPNEPTPRETEVFIAGGGPAGLAAAIAARNKGFDVIVADGGHPPIDKPCGEGLLPDAIAALRRLGVVFGPADGFALRGIRFRDAKVSVAAAFRDGIGMGTRRTVLHRKLVERAEACGVRFAWNTPVSAICESGVIAGGNKIHARWIIGADGILSRVRRWAGLDSTAPHCGRFAYRQHFRVPAWSEFAEVYWHNDEQIYITPISSDEICVALISGSSKVRVADALSKVPALARKFQGAISTTRERGAPTRVRGLARVRRGNIALVGDASGSVDAITAEGLALGFRQAEALANALAAGNLAQYQQAHRRLFLRPRFMAHLLLFLGSQPALRNHTFRVMEAAPNIFDCMLAYHVGETRPLELATTGAQFSWKFLTALV